MFGNDTHLPSLPTLLNLITRLRVLDGLTEEKGTKTQIWLTKYIYTHKKNSGIEF